MAAFGILGITEPGDETNTLLILAEQTVRVPPPLLEPLHWLIRTASPVERVPVAVQVSDVPPPLPEPLH